MLEGKKILGIIPARGGSRRLPRKNIRMFAGKPLIAWTIEEAGKSQIIDRLIVSSEDKEIIEVAARWGAEVPFIRPAELARDETPGIAPVIHAIQTLKENYDYIVLLQPTSPLRTVGDIDECIRYCIRRAAPVCASVSIIKGHTGWMFTLDDNNCMTPLLPEANPGNCLKDLPVYMLNGAIFMARTEYLLKQTGFVTAATLAYIMPVERSLDVDTELDFCFGEFIKSRERLNTCG
ncbi:MAG: acylneuraminate cytidylyltransferase family protein [Syntrophomonadaceae bacterium]|nr:acylneuraminate cytidylyltransferase family protein [Syntrophomonadaceae bacterium]